MSAWSKPVADTAAAEVIVSHIRLIRGQRVLLDADLARLYGVGTKTLNQAVKRNAGRFPIDFAFRLNSKEWSLLSGAGNRSQSVTGSQKHRDPRSLPQAFTEHGALMAANILRSRRAVEMSVFVIRAFVKMREALAANAAVLQRLAEIDRNLLVHDSALRDVYRKLLPLLSPPPETPKPKIGFHPGSR
jgi:hypothetical protein